VIQEPLNDSKSVSDNIVAPTYMANFALLSAPKDVFDISKTISPLPVYFQTPEILTSQTEEAAGEACLINEIVGD
jgi:hypothetical protein